MKSRHPTLSRLLRIRSGGQTMLTIVIALPVIIGSMALVFDVGNLYWNKIRMQTATDSAVLSGAEYLPNYQSQAISVATSYAEQNGIAASEIVSVTVSPDDKEIILTAARTLPCYFCAVLGESTAHAQSSPSGTAAAGSVTTISASGIVPIRSASGVVPIGIDYRTTLTFGQEVALKQGQLGPGNWGPLALGSTGADAYRANIETGYSGVLTAGTDWLQTEPGNIVGPTQDAFNYRINLGADTDPGGTFAAHSLSDQRVMLVPLVDFSNVNGSSEVPLKGFAMLWIVSIDGQGTIDCYFIQQSVPNAIADSSGAATGATTAVLLK